MLLFGRFLAIGANLVVQVLLVRSLPQAEYGAFAYCLAIANIVTVLVSLGMEQTMSRYAAIYDETDNHDRLSGAILFFVAVVVALGAVVVVAAIIGRDSIQRNVVHDRMTVELLAMMILLGPLQALDTLASTLFAVFARPKAIFWRRYVISPGLRIGVVVVVLAANGSVFMLGAGYVVASIVGLLIYLPPLTMMLRRRGVFVRGTKYVFPIRELMRFTAGGVAADLLVITLFASDVIIVGKISGPKDVALLQAVQPLANGNLVVFFALVPLFIPVASRLFVNGATQDARDLYARASVWIAVFTFPVAAITICCAVPVVDAFFGNTYASAAPILAMLSLSQYLLAVFGLTTLTLKAHGSLRNLAYANILVVVLNITLNISLVRAYGPVGAAMGTLGATTVLTAAKLGIMRHDLGIWPVERVNARVFASIVGYGALIAIFVAVSDAGLVVMIPLVCAVSLLLVRTTRRELAVLEVFPEAGKLAPVRRLMA